MRGAGRRAATGAPLWTFEEVGLDLTKFDEAEAAFVMQHRYDPHDRDSYPDMSWLQNGGRFAPCTMWTLFFGGRDFAPSCNIGGVNAQDYLQQHYIDAMRSRHPRERQPKGHWVRDVK